VIIRGSEGGPITVARLIGRPDNNIAEYVALLEAWQCALTLSAEGRHVYSDSEVVVKPMKGAYTVAAPAFIPLTGSAASWPDRSLSRYRTFPVRSISKLTRAPIPQFSHGLLHPSVRGISDIKTLPDTQVRLRVSASTGHERPPSHRGVQFAVVVYSSLVSVSLWVAYRRVMTPLRRVPACEFASGWPCVYS
jgi:hypothetical protein